MQKAVRARKDFYECAEINYARDRAEVCLADFRFSRQTTNASYGRIGCCLVCRCNRDRPVVLNVNLSAGLFDQSANDLAARPNNVAYLVRVDLNLDDARRVVGERLARACNGLFHCVQDIHAPLLSLRKCLGHNLRVDAADLDVHLERCDAVVRACDLKIHVAVMVFSARYVRQDCVLVAFHDQTHRYARDRSFDGHARVHQRQRAAANGSHRA